MSRLVCFTAASIYRFEQNKIAHGRPAKEDVSYLLTTKLFCGKCGTLMGGESGTSHMGNTSADATFVLEKEKRASDTAKLYGTGRDTPYQEYTLRFRDCRWELVERKTQEQLAKETIPACASTAGRVAMSSGRRGKVSKRKPKERA